MAKKSILNKKSIQFLMITALLSFTIGTEAYEKEGKIEKEFNIGNNTRIEFSNKSSDLNIKLWNKESVKLECFYKLRANDEDDVLTTIEVALDIKCGETTKDKFFTLEQTACIGCCDEAPAMRVNDQTYTNLTKAKVLRILEEYKEGTLC